MLQDKDLLSIQNARNLVVEAEKAQKIYAHYSQEKMDNLIKAISCELSKHSEELAKMAVEETGFGKYEDKIFKNMFASITVYNYIKDQKVVGILENNTCNKIMSIGVPVGVIAGLVPSTNPTSTVIYKSLIALKSGNAIVFSPHPFSIKCITKTVDLIKDVIKSKGFDPSLVSVLPIATIKATDELMKLSNLILATGGPDMVKAAYSSGTPALGVGPGNVPAFIEKSANITHAVKCIIASKTFDYGTICASEQMVVVEECIADKVEEEFKRQGGYFLNSEDQAKMERLIIGPSGRLNAKIVGKSPETLAEMAKISIPKGTKVIIGKTNGVGKKYPFSVEKLSPLLGFYVEKDWKEACNRCIEILEFEGKGHSLAIHSTNEEVIKEFALYKPVYRLLVNTPSTHGGIGASTSIAPALTLGCGSVGGSSISDNVEPKHLVNIRRLAYGVKEIEELAFTGVKTDIKQESSSIGKIDIELIASKVVEQLRNSNKI